ncbi:hypothetical protein OS493_016154 [Desmophyllum pertusum]|uniref:Uncharacterized protein n=1 Tax=Desmophyllum pertusum TaxID=174260 RepID=A0A9X0A2Y8_9CNID|nr:hypothetical protein OS493_016154 [Desmophyllum pertusum]
MFDCKATSDLGVKYFWFQRVKESSSATSILKLDKRFNIFPNGSLEIRRVQKKDEAFYHCRAENPIGYNNVTAFMRVLVPPSFTIRPRSAAEPSGSSPVNIQKSDEGKYTCSATSSLKTITAGITISVYTACRIDPQPHAVHQPNSKFFAAGEKVIVDCKSGFGTKQDGNLSCQDDGNWDKNFPRCTDLDECAILASLPNPQNDTKLQRCHEKASCVNTAGSYRCQCIVGYAGDGFTCIAVCMPPKQQDNGKWTPEKPSYNIGATVWLNCATGFKLTDSSISSATCGKDTQWSSPSPTCQDKNECEEGTPCHETADCINTDGSFTCRCKKGFEGDGVNECKEKKKRIVTGSDGKAWKYSDKMNVLDEKLKQYEQNSITAEQLLDAVLNSSAPGSDQLLPGDLVMVIKGINTAVLNMNSKQRLSTAKQTLQISSNILDKNNKDQWSELQKDSKGVTEVMSLLDKFAMELADDLEKQSSSSNDNATINIKMDNIEMKVMVKEANKFSSDVEYPEDSKQSNDGSAQIRLPQQLFSKYKDDTLVKVTSFLFKDLGELMPKRGEGITKFDVSSPIVSSSLSPAPSDGKLDPPVTITMTNEKPADVEAIDKCVYWDFEKSKELGGSWSADGCRVVSSGSNGTVCECDHLTSFTSLSVYDKELVLTLIIYIGCGVLLLAVLIALIRHFYLYRKRHSERSIVHINFCLAIAAGIGIFLGGIKLTKIPVVCLIIAALLQYFFVATFCWAVCEGLQLFMTLMTGKNSESSRLNFPAGDCRDLSRVTQLQGYGNSQWCWLDYTHVLMWAYVCPAAGFILVSLVLMAMVLCVKRRVVEFSDKRKVCLSVLFLFILIIAIGGTWVLAAIYVKHHENNLWQYVFAGACALQGILLLVYCLLDQDIKNFTFHYQIQKARRNENEKRNFYSTTDKVEYLYGVTRPSIKESNTDLRGSSKRLSRVCSTTAVFEDEPDYPPPIMDTPAPMDSVLKRNIEGEPIPETPGGEAIRLFTFPSRKGSSSYYSSIPSESVSDRRPDGAEEPDLAIGERRNSKSSMRKSADTLLSSHSKLQQIPEREPLVHSGYHQTDSPPPYNSEVRPRPYELKKKSPYEEDHSIDYKDEPLDSSRRKSRRSRRRLEEEFGKSDRESISQRKKSLRYSSGFFSGVTVEQDPHKVEKPHASL